MAERGLARVRRCWLQYLPRPTPAVQVCPGYLALLLTGKLFFPTSKRLQLLLIHSPRGIAVQGTTISRGGISVPVVRGVAEAAARRHELVLVLPRLIDHELDVLMYSSVRDVVRYHNERRFRRAAPGHVSGEPVFLFLPGSHGRQRQAQSRGQAARARAKQAMLGI